MRASEFFQHPQTAAHKKYEALRAFYVEGKSAAEVAQQFGYTLSSFYSLTRDFKRQLSEPNPSQQFFLVSAAGRQPKDPTQTTQRLIVELRKKFLSVPDIKARLDALGYRVSERYIYNVVKQAGFSRLPRRSQGEKEEAVAAVKLPAPTTQMLTYAPESFSSCLTTYEHLKNLDNQPTPIKFITIRRRGKRIVEELNALPKSQWKKVRVAAADGKGRLLQVHEEILFLKGYDKKNG